LVRFSFAEKNATLSLDKSIKHKFHTVSTRNAKLIIGLDWLIQLMLCKKGSGKGKDKTKKGFLTLQVK